MLRRGLSQADRAKRAELMLFGWRESQEGWVHDGSSRIMLFNKPRSLAEAYQLHQAVLSGTAFFGGGSRVESKDLIGTPYAR